MKNPYIELVKPRITTMSVATAAAGFALAPGEAGPWTFWSALVGTFLLVSAANALNMYLERDVDRHMSRTRNRPLPGNRLAPKPALYFGLGLLALAAPILFLGTNALTGWLGMASFFLYVMLYTPMKQVSTFALLVGAIPGAAPPLLGWCAKTGTLDLAGIALFAVIFVWQVPHFLAITLFRHKEYDKANVKTLPSTLGEGITKHAIVNYLILQILVTLSLVPLGVGGMGYLFAALILGAFLLGFAVSGLRDSAGPRWAKQFFLATVVYLPLLFGFMFV